MTTYQEDFEYIEKIEKHLRYLLEYFGLRLTGFSPGVSAIDDKYSYSFGGAEWHWLEPLLDELRGWRESQ